MDQFDAYGGTGESEVVGYVNGSVVHVKLFAQAVSRNRFFYAVLKPQQNTVGVKLGVHDPSGMKVDDDEQIDFMNLVVFVPDPELLDVTDKQVEDLFHVDLFVMLPNLHHCFSRVTVFLQEPGNSPFL